MTEDGHPLQTAEALAQHTPLRGPKVKGWAPPFPLLPKASHAARNWTVAQSPVSRTPGELQKELAECLPGDSAEKENAEDAEDRAAGHLVRRSPPMNRPAPPTLGGRIGAGRSQ